MAFLGLANPFDWAHIAASKLSVTIPQMSYILSQGIGALS